MSLLDGLLHRLLVLRRGERYSDEIAKELRFHADLEALAQRAENHDQLAAELAARRMLGNSTYYREEVRRMTPLAWVDAIRQDFDYARRGLMRAPGFTLAIALTLGLGIGVNASVFSFLDALFTRPPTGVAAPNDVHRLYIEQVNTREHTGRMTQRLFPLSVHQGDHRHRRHVDPLRGLHRTRLRRHHRRRITHPRSAKPCQRRVLRVGGRSIPSVGGSSPATRVASSRPRPSPS